MLRVAIVVSGVLATVIAATADSIYGLFVLCSDLMYVVLFPQLTLILWFQPSNGYGCLAGFFVAFLLRFLAGEPLLGLPALLQFPLYDHVRGQFFPFRTTIMLCNVITIIVVSLLSHLVFRRGWLPDRFDILRCLRERTIDMRSEAKQRQPMTVESAAVTDGVRWASGSTVPALSFGDKATLALPEDDY